MYKLLLLAGLVIAVCVLSGRMASRLPVPSLIVFIALGMLCGTDGPLHISFEDYGLTEAACNTGLLFIMFYGGFNANVREARPVAAQAVVLSTAGVLVTAALVGAFCHLALGLGWVEGLLVGSVISSTDAASVFNVLRSAKLSLKDGTDSLLEIESGSNDPASYMLTSVLVCVLGAQDVSVPGMVAAQLVFGIGFGLGVAKLAELALGRINMAIEQGETIFLIAAAIVSYALPSVFGGNGFLAAYLCGIWLGNADIPQKRNMARTFDVITEICQMGIFFLLGLLVTPSRLGQAVPMAVAVFVFITLVARPLGVFAILRPFGASAPKIALTSAAGLRGAASVVFSLSATAVADKLPCSLFDIVFVVVLLSLVVQGAALPALARRLDMIDASANVMRTFNDFQEESDLSLVKIEVGEDLPAAGRALRDICVPRDLLVVLVLRDGTEKILPGGNTVLERGDELICAAPTFEDQENLTLHEIRIGERHRWAGRLLREIPEADRIVIVMLKRGNASIIPNGDTRIEPGDLAFVAGGPRETPTA